MKTVRFHEAGGPEVLQVDDIDVADPGPGEVQIRHGAIGLNYIDTYHRSGLYPLPLPSGIGLEAAGTVIAVGDGVSGLKEGDRVAYGAGPIGAYSEVRNAPAGRVSKLPDTISDETAAAMMLKGMTVRYLLRETYRVSEGETILFHAAAGGVGLIAGQWAKALGVNAIGTAGSDEKCELAKAHGYAHVINYNTEDVVARVKEITNGKGVPVAYDSVGQATSEMSLDSLAPRGMFVTFGNASGPITNFDLGTLAAKGSLYVTRPTLMTYVAADADLAANAADLFEMVSSGKVKIEINQRYGLSDAVRAHADLEGRRTTGSTVIVPD